MSDYTITLKRCSEIYGKDEILSWFKNYDELNYISYDEYTQITKADIFGNVPFSKDFLARLIFEHYYLREIAYETPEMFRHYAKVKLQEIMRKISSTYLFSFIEI